ncbi:hypothetical protein VTI28DRAFT_4362 [Corynascus sepedonium]
MADKRTTAQLDRLALYPATPPETASPDSLTPSVGLPVSGVDNIIAEIRNRICGRVEVEEEWWCISLSRDEFKAFKARFEAEGDYRWPKYDYFPQLAKFVLRMAGTVHEAVIGRFERLVTRQLDIIEQSNDQVAADFARDVHVTRSPKTESDGGSHYPDGSFAHEDAGVECVILEVSHSQQRQDLPFLADEYILGSNGRTQVVIGVDLEYREEKGKEARVTVWRPRYIEEDGEAVLEAAETETGIFRAVDGSLVDGERILRIGLKDFGYWPNCLRIDDIPGEITISFSQLYEIVEQAEARAERRDREHRKMRHENHLKRSRVRSPPQQVTESDEERFKAAEKKVKRQLDDQDSDYIPE